MWNHIVTASRGWARQIPPSKLDILSIGTKIALRGWGKMLNSHTWSFQGASSVNKCSLFWTSTIYVPFFGRYFLFPLFTSRLFVMFQLHHTKILFQRIGSWHGRLGTGPVSWPAAASEAMGLDIYRCHAGAIAMAECLKAIGLVVKGIEEVACGGCASMHDTH